MTADHFNNRYRQYLAEGHYGLALNLPEVIDYLDKKFQKFIKVPGFVYYQIKMKYGYINFYAEGISDEEVSEVEREIKELYKKHDENIRNK